MKKNKLSVCFFGTYDKNFTSNRIIKEGLEENDVAVVTVNAHIPVTRLNSKEDMGFIPLVKRIWKKNRIFVEIFNNLQGIRTCDVIYVGYPGHFDVIYAYLLKITFRKKLMFNPLVVFYTGMTEEQKILKKDSILGRILKAGEVMIYKMCDIVVADTPFQKDHFMKEFSIPENKITVIPIGADDKVYPYQKKTRKDITKLNVVYYGLYSPVHGTEFIIEAAHLLKNTPGITFTMVGKGNTFERDYKKAQELKLENVIFYPEMTEIDALATLQDADIFLGFLLDHPVVMRVIPNKVYQGLALGKAVVTASADCILSVFEHKKNIYVVKPSSAEDLARGIKELHTHPELLDQIAQNGYELYRKSFTPRSVGRILKNVITSL